ACSRTIIRPIRSVCPTPSSPVELSSPWSVRRWMRHQARWSRGWRILVACGALVALVSAQVDAPPGALESRVAHLLADLKRLTRARRTAPPLAPFPAECLAHETPAHLDQSEAGFQALAPFLHDSLAAERVSPARAVRIVLNLLAGLWAMLTHQYGHTAAEVEARIDRLSSPLRSQITAYHRQRDQGGERPSPW